MATYTDLITVWQNEEFRMLKRASEEIRLMLSEMGVKEGEYFDLPKSKKFQSVAFQTKKSSAIVWEKCGILIKTLYYTGHADLPVNYYEICEPTYAVRLHYDVLAEYNRWKKNNKNS